MHILLNTKHWLLSLSAAAILTGCGAGDGNSTDAVTAAQDEFDTAAMLQNLAHNVVIPAYDTVIADAGKLQEDINLYCASIGDADEATQLDAVQQSWRTAMASWQVTEAFLIGPAANNSNNLRNRIYSYGAQNLSECGIDQAVVLNQTGSFNLSTRANSSKGLDAIEYLLFSTELNHHCPSQVQETSNWDNLSATTQKLRRCDYARTLASDVVTAATAIASNWDENGDNFQSTFLNPLNTAASLESVSDALFFVDKELQDLKLGGPLGRSGCTPVDCTNRSQAEAPYSGNSYANIKANLQGFEAIVFGDNGLSFDDLIVSVGQQALNTKFSDTVSAAIALIDQQTGSLSNDINSIVSEQQLAECEMAIAAPNNDSNLPVCQLYGHIKTLSDSLKTEFILATNLEIPERAQSDND